MSLTLTKKYKASFILDTRGYDSPVETLVEKLEGLLKELGAEVQASKNLGRHDFVRVTEKGHTGDTYLEIEFSADPTVPAALHEKLRLDKTVKRILVEGC